MNIEHSKGGIVIQSLKGFVRSFKNGACEDLNECETDIFPCGRPYYGECLNLEGTYACDCNQGFENINQLDSQCIDIDECNLFDCGFDNYCINTIGSYQCM